jgi:hypothetical protein
MPFDTLRTNGSKVLADLLCVPFFRAMRGKRHTLKSKAPLSITIASGV